MKNLLVFTLIIGLFAVTGCKKTADETKDAADKAVETTENAAQKTMDKAKEVSDAVTSSMAIPQFKDEAITNYLKDYSAFVSKYEIMMAKKEQVSGEQMEEMKAQLEEMRKQAQDFTRRSAEVTAKLKKDEISKFNEFFKNMQMRWAEANK